MTARPAPAPPAGTPARDPWAPPGDLKLRATVILVAAAVFYAWSGNRAGVSPAEFVDGLPAMGHLFRRMWPPAWSYLPTMVKPMVETIQIAILGTTFGALLAMPLAGLAARNVAPNRAVFWVARIGLNAVRTLPDLLLAAILAVALGIGALPGVMALTIFSLGIIAKLSFETIEGIDPGPLEALAAVGATRAQTMWYAVVPQVLPQFVAFCLYVFEINVRVATVLGLVGAGGIGLWLYRDINLLRYRHALAIILVIFAVVSLIDYVSARLRARIV